MVTMKKRLLPLAVVCTRGFGTSCTTMYDSYGRPVDVITPEGAALAVVAAGVVGYAIADNNRGRHRGRGHNNHRGHGHGYGHGYGHGQRGY